MLPDRTRTGTLIGAGGTLADGRMPDGDRLRSVGSDGGGSGLVAGGGGMRAAIRLRGGGGSGVIRFTTGIGGGGGSAPANDWSGLRTSGSGVVLGALGATDVGVLSSSR